MYIEIAEGMSVNTDKIEAVARDTELTSLVYANGNQFRSTFPYEVLLQLIDRAEEPEENEVQKKQLRILETLGSYAG